MKVEGWVIPTVTAFLSLSYAVYHKAIQPLSGSKYYVFWHGAKHNTPVSIVQSCSQQLDVASAKVPVASLLMPGCCVTVYILHS